MDTVHGLGDGRNDGPDAVAALARETDGDGHRGGQHDSTESGVNDVMFDLGGDERRMHVRAYNHWVSLLKARPYPSIADLEPETITDFGPHSVLLDFSHGLGDPKIAYLGRALREECGLEGRIATIADVPSRSLLSRLTDHYLQIIANRAPIGFEAEFVSSRGRTTLYRGILMPFSSSGDAIDFIYGVINWKELANADLQAELSAELDAAVRATPYASTEVAQGWADGPSGGFEIEPSATTVEEFVLDVPLPLEYAPPENALTGPLREQLAVARESAAQVRAAEARAQVALCRTLGRAYDLALSAERNADDYAALLSASCALGQPEAMMQIVKLVFVTGFETARQAELADVLSHARRHQVPFGGLASFLQGFGENLSTIAAAERSAA